MIYSRMGNRIMILNQHTVLKIFHGGTQVTRATGCPRIVIDTTTHRTNELA